MPIPKTFKLCALQNTTFFIILCLLDKEKSYPIEQIRNQLYAAFTAKAKSTFSFFVEEFECN